MSSLGASALRHLEKLIEKIRRGTRLISRSPPRLLEYVMVGIVRTGERIENGFIQYTRLFTKYLQKLQRSISESVLLASLWAGLLFTLALLIIAIINVLG